MKITTTPIIGACIIELARHDDSRGSNEKLFSSTEFGELGLPQTVAQINRSKSTQEHTLRGLHYQLPPHQDSKTVICTKGSVYDVFVDLRSESKTYMQYFGVTIRSTDPRIIHLPGGLAHGILTLEDDTEIVYYSNASYNANSERGIRWNDPHFKIKWPAKPKIISEKDANLPDFSIEYNLQHTT